MSLNTNLGYMFFIMESYGSSCFLATMHARGTSLPTYDQACQTEIHPFWDNFFGSSLRDPLLLVITVATVIGSFCLLSGLALLCMVSQELQDRTSEAILLLSIGFFISAVASISWKLTSERRITHIIDALKEHEELV